MTMIPPSLPPERRPSQRTLGELLGIPSTPEGGGAQQLTLPLRAVTVRASIAGDCAVTELTEHYANTSDLPLDVLHTIPLPASCAVIGFEIKAGDRVVRGLCRAKAAAREEFEAAKARGKSTAIVERVRDDLHRISLANVPPRTEIEVTLRLAERLGVKDGRFEYRLPTALSPKYVPGTPTGHDGDGWSLDTDDAPDASHLTPPMLVDTQIPVRLEVRIAHGVTQVMPSIALNERQRPDGTVVFEPAAPLTCSGDVVIRFWTRTERAAMRAYTDGERTLVVLDPPADRTPALERTREAVFVLDRSGSMRGTRLSAAKKALAHALRALKPTDLFRVIAFDDKLESSCDSLVPATSKHVSAAIKWAKAIHARGGTEAIPALRAACTPPVNAGHVRTVLFITDGAVGNDTQLLQLTSKLDPACRITVMGIGRAPSNALLERLARLGGGTCTIVTSDDDIAAELKSLDAELAGPIAFGLHEAGTDPSACRTADLFAGRGGTLFLDGARTRVKLTSADGAFAAECDVTPSPMPLGPLWARAEVERLEDRRISHPAEAKEIDAAIERLGLAHHIQTRMTSFVAVDEQSRVTGEAISLVQPVSRADDARHSVVACSMAIPLGYADVAEDLDDDSETVECMQDDECDEETDALLSQPDPTDPDEYVHPMVFLTAWPAMRLSATMILAQSRRWQALANGLALLEERQHRLSFHVATGTDPAIALTVLLMMLACDPQRLGRDLMPKSLVHLDLSRNGEPWKRWMAVLAPLRGDSRIDRIVCALERGDMREALAAANGEPPRTGE
jgi:Ca-activated chloride channel family protein